MTDVEGLLSDADASAEAALRWADAIDRDAYLFTEDLVDVATVLRGCERAMRAMAREIGRLAAELEDADRTRADGLAQLMM